MTTDSDERRSTADPARAPDGPRHGSPVTRRASRAIGMTSSGAATLIRRAPGALATARAGARDATTALQTLPDPALRSLAATSVGIGAGLRLAGAPRLAVAAAVASAMLVGAAIALRPAVAPPGPVTA